MDGPRPDPFASLRANTLIWIAVVIIPLVSLIIVAAWVVALRERRQDTP